MYTLSFVCLHLTASNLGPDWMSIRRKFEERLLLIVRAVTHLETILHRSKVAGTL